MAELRKITKRAPLSGFSQVAPEGGSAFKAFADVAQQGYQLLKPALDAAEAEYGAEVARRQIGQNAYPIVPQTQPTTAAGGGDLASFSPDDDDAFIASLTGTESGGRLNALNNEVGAGGVRGHGGRLQFGDARLSEAAQAGIIGRMSPQEYAQQPLSVQKAVETWHFGDIDRKAQQAGLDYYIGKTVGGAPITQNSIRAMAHLGGFNGAKRYLESGGEYNPADSFGTTLKDYALKHGSVQTARAAGVDPDSGMALVQDSAVEAIAPAAPPTLVRTAEGKIEPRMHSPMAEGLMLATSAAAQTGYLSEMLMQGGTDIMGLSQNFAGDPAGFQQAAQSYIDQAVKAAPAMMKGNLRSRLTQDSQRRYLGIMEEHQRDVRQRANNSSTALYQRYQSDYAEALAAGNFDEASAARGLLEDILTARESLPGVAWTREQSENVILGAQDTAARIAEQNRTKLKSEQAGTLRTIIAAAEAGQTAADEAILDDPNVLAANPELASEAAAKVALREAMPGFFQLSPAEMDAAIKAERGRAVEDGWELDLLKPMEDARNLAVTGLASDPIGYAQERLSQKPPAIDPINVEDPQPFIASLAARREYARGMVGAGYVETPAFLSKAEIGTLSAALSKTSPVEVRVATAGALVAGFGPDAAQVFKAVNADPVITWGGALIARGGPGNIVAEAMQGQAIIDQRQAQMPAEEDWRSIVQNDFRAALAGLPTDTVQAEAELMQFAKALYANRAAAPGFDGDEAVMRDAIQAALGQSRDPRGNLVGGVQDFFGHQTLMPLGVNADAVEKAFQKAMAVDWGVTRAVDGAPLNLDASSNLEFWSDISIQRAADGSFVSGGAPRIGGEYLPLSLVRNGDVRFVPIGGTQYRMEVQRSGAVLDVHTPEGALYIIDLARL
ncbi:hypothetical protein [Paracoccus fontiphilus]|uniref:Uncharacterized protein n=1 Tax=Paracoccus fontiphilus TaxID=1815556 RepID=A0ABV7IDM7_9RHOB|nr:hypothetical protein [Paracoccus fontiphilus]